MPIDIVKRNPYRVVTNFLPGLKKLFQPGLAGNNTAFHRVRDIGPCPGEFPGDILFDTAPVSPGAGRNRTRTDPIFSGTSWGEYIYRTLRQHTTIIRRRRGYGFPV
jgi:hypothetical protein